MSTKAERLIYVECDSCGMQHSAREISTYAARVKAGADGWVYTDPGRGAKKYDQCAECWSGHVEVPRDVPQRSDGGGEGQETG